VREFDIKTDGRPLGHGDRIRLIGDRSFAWGGGSFDVVGLVLGAVFSGAGDPFRDVAIVVRLDEPLAGAGAEALFAVLHQDGEAGWFRRTGTVRVELCDFDVAGDHGRDRRRGQFVEEAVLYERLNEPEPDEAGPYEELESRWRTEGRLSPVATIGGCEAKWRWLVEEVRKGYDDDEYEWTNDLASRRIVQRAIDELPRDLALRLEDRVRPWDDVYRSVTRPVRRPYWSGGWWADRLPSTLGPKLAAALGDHL
jgi:hypothetical protein